MPYLRTVLVLLSCAISVISAEGDTCSIEPITNVTEFLGDYPAANVMSEAWKPARGYSWTVSCWTQAAFRNETINGTIRRVPADVEGGTSADCPPGLRMEIESPVLSLEKNEEFDIRFSLFTSDEANFTADSELGWGYEIPHVAAYGCMASDCLYCIPAVDLVPNITGDAVSVKQIRQIVPEKKMVIMREYQLFTVPLSLNNIGANTIAVNINLFDQSKGQLVIMALALDIDVRRPAKLSPGAIVAISAASIAFAVLFVVLLFVLFRYKMIVKKVKELEPRKYPKNLPQPVMDLAALEGIASNTGTVHSKDFMALEKLGMGEFGDVFKGACFTSGSAAFCAIKSLKEEHREMLADKFLEEAEIMRHMRHPNVVRIIGVSGTTEDDIAQICILMEFCSNGDLKNYLMKSPQISTMEKLWYGYQLALGCEYIAECNLVHRDIAARNCLLAEAGPNGLLVAKVSDFGLARAFEEHNPSYVMEGSGKLPLRWMSTEAIINREFHQASDVWAYGITLWEIFSQGKTPYAGRQTFSLAASIAGGVRCERPSDTPTETYHLMSQCWMERVEDRPTFKQIAGSMKRMFDEAYAAVGANGRALSPISTVNTGPMIDDFHLMKKTSKTSATSAHSKLEPAYVDPQDDIGTDAEGYTNPSDMLTPRGSDLEKGLSMLGDYTSIRIKDEKIGKRSRADNSRRNSSKQTAENKGSNGSRSRKAKTVLPVDTAQIASYTNVNDIQFQDTETPPSRPAKGARKQNSA